MVIVNPPSTKPSFLRVAATSTLLFGTLGAVVALVRVLPASPAGWLGGAVLGAIALILAASPVEWVVHRYVYHRRVFPGMHRIHAIHEEGHHHTIFPTWRYVTNGPVRRHPILSSTTGLLHSSRLRNLGIKASHFMFYLALGGVCIWLPAWLATRHVAFLAGIVGATLIVADLFVRVHDAIHYPAQNRFIRAQPWFEFLARHHYIHHVDTNANVNFLLPLADFLFGTMRRALTCEELARHGSMEEATALPLGMSEPAKEVAKPRARRSPFSSSGPTVASGGTAA